MLRLCTLLTSELLKLFLQSPDLSLQLQDIASGVLVHYSFVLDHFGPTGKIKS